MKKIINTDALNDYSITSKMDKIFEGKYPCPKRGSDRDHCINLCDLSKYTQFMILGFIGESNGNTYRGKYITMHKQFPTSGFFFSESPTGEYCNVTVGFNLETNQFFYSWQNYKNWYLYIIGIWGIY